MATSTTEMRLATLIVAALAFAGAACAADPDVIDAHASYPEGPLFAGRTLYVAEMGADRVSAYEIDAKFRARRHTFFHAEGCGPTAIAPYRNGYLILCHLAGELVAVDAQGREVGRFGKHLLRDPNDGYADTMGGVYFSDPGDFTKDSVPSGLVYRLAPDGALQKVAGDLWYPNGVYVDAGEKAVYVCETFARKVWRYDMGGDGALTNKTLFADIDAIDPPTPYKYREAGPDGLERAPDGEMIVSIYGEGHLLRIGRDGKLAGEIKVPTQYETNIAFGAPGAVVVGAFDNVHAPLPGQVRWWRKAKD